MTDDLVFACLHKTWIEVLKSKDILPGKRLEETLRRVLLNRAAHHLYRGEALAVRAGKLHKAWQEWVASHEPFRHPSEDESLDWLAAELEKIEREVP